jgi:TROVE domain
MSKLNTGSRKPKVRTGPMITEQLPSGKTHEGAKGFARDAKTELFMRATTVFAGEGSFYEQDKTADDRAIELVRKLAVDDWTWTSQFLAWLRLGGKIRTFTLVLAAEAAFARLKAGRHGAAGFEGIPQLTTRQVIDQVCQRADEPCEVIQYCLKTSGKVPIAIKRGVADAAVRLWNEAAVLRWDKPDRPVRFADVIELVHPKAKAPWQSELFRYLLDQRHHEVREISPVLQGISARKGLSALEPRIRHAFAAAALTQGPEDTEAAAIRSAAVGQWEWVTSWLGEGVRNAGDWTPLTERQRWELIIPQMSYMALLRNLRNFDKAGLKDDVVAKIIARLTDPKKVADSRQLPFRFLSAYLNVPSVRWSQALETALSYAIPNVPRLDGHTLIVVDRSGSMFDLMGTDELKRNKLLKDGKTPPKYPSRLDAALVFATALALKNIGHADMYCFADGNFRVDNIEHGASVLRTVELIKNHRDPRLGGGTYIERNVRAIFDSSRHTRVILLTDEQAFPSAPDYKAHWRPYIGDVGSAIPASVPLYSWNLAGYTYGCFPAGDSRYSLGGLSDASFSIMQQIENGKNGTWPWENKEVFVPEEDEDE